MKHRQKMEFSNYEVYFPLKQKADLISSIAQKHFNGKFIDLGCGKKPYANIIGEYIIDYIGVDIENERYQQDVKPDFFWNGQELPFEKNTFDSGMLIEVLEHVPYPEKVLREFNRVLKTDSKILITVPFLWTLHDIPNDEYRYTPFALKRIVENAGFSIVEIESLGGWHASFANFLSLYIKRGPWSKRRKKILAFIFKPFIKYLYKKDLKYNKSVFNNGDMLIGLWCLAQKK